MEESFDHHRMQSSCPPLPESLSHASALRVKPVAPPSIRKTSRHPPVGSAHRASVYGWSQHTLLGIFDQPAVLRFDATAASFPRRVGRKSDAVCRASELDS